MAASTSTAGRHGTTWRARLPPPRPSLVFLLAALLSAMFLRHLVFDPDPNKCQALVTSGQWYPSGGNTWLTSGCHNIYHASREITDCTNGEKRKMVFAGDLQTQGIYWAIAKRLQRDLEIPPFREEDLSFGRGNVELEFIWDPFLNGTKIVHRAEDLRDGKSIKPMLTVVGAGKWHVEHGAIGEYPRAVRNLADIAYSGRLPKVPLGSSGVFGADDGPGDLLLFAPVQEPYDEAPDAAGRAASSELNQKLQEVAREDAAFSVLWSFNLMTAGRKDLFTSDSEQVTDEVFRRQADVLLNLRCNANVGRKGHFPNLAVCCAVWRGPNWVQMTFLLFGLAILPAVVLLDLRFRMLSDEHRSVVRAFCAFSSAISLVWMADRTHFFEQVARLDLVDANLRSMILFAFLLGFITVRRSQPPRNTTPDSVSPPQPFLPRDQSDEWKGWMQVLIIIYHYNKAWTNTPFWEVIRLAVSSYLWLTGFGHTLYFLQKKDYSFKRFANIMIRTNLLPVALAYIMRTRWLLYYYMPLSTFWFIVVYATLSLKKTWNDHTHLLLGKLLASAALVHQFISTTDLAETVAKFFALTCSISFDADGFFHSRVAQDQYIVYVGMLAAVFYIWSKDVLASEKRQDVLSRAFRRSFPGLKYLAIAVSGTGFVYFWSWTDSNITTQPEFTVLQPYITAIPILTFLVLRNAHPSLRSWHSTAFAWLGRYSGEMYVLQDHIWLAGDQEAVLRSGLFHGNETLVEDRWRDLLVLTPLYLAVCCVIGDATGVIANWFVKEDAPVVMSVAGPVAEVELGLLAEDDGDPRGSMELSKKMDTRPSVGERFRGVLWPRTVRNRALLVLGLLWLLNMTYT